MVISQVVHYLAGSPEVSQVIVLTPTAVLHKQLINSYFSKNAPNREKITHVTASDNEMLSKFFNMPDTELKSTVVVIDAIDSFVL